MNETSELYNKQVQILLTTIDNYQSEIDVIASELIGYRDLYNTGTFVHYKEFTSRQSKMKRLVKRMKECSSTIASISDKIEYEESDFADDANMVLYRSEVIAHTVPRSASSGHTLSFNATLMNAGFRAWNKTNARLKVIVENDTESYQESYVFFLPDELSIALGESHVFSVETEAFAENGVYTLRMFMENDTYGFAREFTSDIYVTS